MGGAIRVKCLAEYSEVALAHRAQACSLSGAASMLWARRTRSAFRDTVPPTARSVR
jgi:hypothetical protein